MTHQSKIQNLPSGAQVMLRGQKAKVLLGRHSRFAPRSLSLALASAFSAASVSISQAITGLSLTLAGLANAQAQSQASSLPQGGVAVHGSATMQQNGTTLNVNTTNGAGNRSVINWQSFNIGAGHTTNINQPNAQSSSLNRVVTNVPSQIHGTLRSNGQVILVNQNGIAVGAGGVVDTAGFTASTLGISDADYKAKRLRFEGNALSGGVQVDGVIRSSNGDIVLFAPNVATGKDALVKADNGNVIVGAGQSVEVTGRGLEGVRFIIQGADNKAINLGTLQGNAVGVFAGTLRHSGVIQAQTATMEGGRVVLRAVKDVEIVKDASVGKAPVIEANGGVNALGVAQNGGSVRIESAQGNVTIGAGSSISANASNLSQNSYSAGINAGGGAIEIIANQGRVISEAGSAISATGSPGGTIRIFGGQEARIASFINASSPSRGAADAAGTLMLLTAQDVGGRIEILSPQTVSLLADAQLIATGDAGGGTILVGGDYQGANAAITNAQDTNISQGVLLEASARVNGDGGKVIVWADNDTYYGGSIKATGGSQGGDGGFGETSGKKNLYFRGRADLSGRRGRTGTLLLDPESLTIQGGGALGTSDDANLNGAQTSADEGGNVSTPYTIHEIDIENLGSSANVILEASGSINFQGTFTDDDLHVTKSLTLRTRNNSGLSDPSSGGISLGGWGNSSFTISAAQGLTIVAGSGYAGTVSGAPSIFSNSGAPLVLQSSIGDIFMQAAGDINLGKGTSLVASNGAITVSSKLSDITISHGSTGTASALSANKILLEAQGFDRLLTLQNGVALNATGSGDVLTLQTDRLTIDNTATVVASAGNIEVRPATVWRQITLGGSTDTSGTGALQISQSEFNRFSATSGVLRVGDTGVPSAAFTGTIHIGGNTGFDVGFYPVALLTVGGSITQSQPLTSNQLRLHASNINLNNGTNSFYKLAARTVDPTGDITISSNSNLSLSTVDGLSGLMSERNILLIDSIGTGTLDLSFGANITAENNITLQNFATIAVYSGNYTIDSNTNNLGNSGFINLGTAAIRPSTAGRGLSLDASSSNGLGGAISFGNVQTHFDGTVTHALNSLIVNSTGTSAGQINLPSSITVGSGGASLTGRVFLSNAVTVSATGTGAITFNGEIQGSNNLSLDSDSGNITLNAIAGNGTNVGTIDIFSDSGAVNLNNDITTTAGTNVSVTASNVNVGNNAEIFAGNLIFLGTHSSAVSNTITTGANSNLFASTGNLTLAAQDDILIGGQAGGNGDVNINSSAGAVIMSSAVNLTGYKSTGVPGTLSIAVHGEAGVTLAHVNATNIYKATVTTGAGQTIASAGNSTQLAGFNSTTLGSSSARSNIGSSSSRIGIGNAGLITAYADTSLYLVSSSLGQNVNLSLASVNTASNTANAEVISQGNLLVGNLSVVGGGIAHIDLLAKDDLTVITSITGTSTSDLVLASDKTFNLGSGPGAISNFAYLGLRGFSSGQKFHFVDNASVSVLGTTQLEYAYTGNIGSSVGHVIIGQPDLSGGEISFEGTGNLVPGSGAAKKYSFFSGGNISSTASRNINVSQAGFSASGNVALNNVTIFNSDSSSGVTVAAKAGGSANVKVTDVDGVTLGTVGGSLPLAAQLSGINASSGNVDFVNTAGSIVSGALTTFDLYANSGSVSVKANGDIGSTGTLVTAHGSSFTLGSAGASPTQSTIAVGLFDTSGTVKTSNITVDKTTPSLSTILLAAKSTSNFEIDNAFGAGNNDAITLSNSTGSIKVSQPNALFSGTGTMTLDASAGVSFETLATIAAGHTVNATTSDATVVSGLGGLSGGGIFNNTGKTLVVDGTLAPGAGGIGTLGVNGSVSMGGTGFLDVDIGTTATNGDRLVVGQDFTAGGLLRIKETNLGATVVGTNYTVGTVGGTAIGGFASVISDTGFFGAALGAQLTVSAGSLINSWINNAGSTLWSAAGNWSRGIVPTADHNVVINPTGTGDTNKLVQLNGGTSSIRSLNISGDDHLQITGGATLSSVNAYQIDSNATLTHTNGAIIGAGDMNVFGTLNLGGGSLGGAGELVTLNGSRTTISAATTSNRNWVNSGVVDITGANGQLTMSGNLSNQAGGVLNMNSTVNTTAIYLSTVSTVFNNAGTINWNSGATAVNSSLNGLASSSFNNSGQFNITGNSNATVFMGGTDIGDYTVNSGSKLSFSGGTRNLQTGSDINGAGTFANTAGTTTVNADFGIGNTGTLAVTGGILTLNTAAAPNFSNPLNLSGGSTLTLNTPDVVFDVPVNLNNATLNGSADFDFTTGSSLTLQSATVSGTGTLGTAAGITTSVTNANSTVGRNWTNAGTVDITGASGQLTISGNLNNQAGGVLNMNSTVNTTAIFLSTVSTVFNNAGTINWNSGAAAVNSSLNGMAGSSFNNSGQFNITGNSKANLLIPTFAQTGTIDIASGSTFARNTGFANSGTLRGGGIVNVGAGSLSSAGGTLSPGGLGAVATLSIAGNVDLTSATLLFDLGSASGDRIAVTGDLNAGGASAKLYETGGSHLEVTDAYSLVTYSGNLTGAPLSLLSQNADISFTASSTGSSTGALVATASSVINRWVDASGTVDWGTASNWSRAHVPTASEDAFINPTDVARAVTLSSGTNTVRSLTVAGDDSLRITGGTLSLTTVSSVTAGATLNMAGGTLNGAGDLNIAGALNWSGGSIGGAGDLFSSGISTITNTATLQRDWNNTGGITIAAGASNSLALQSAATLTNAGSLRINSALGGPIDLTSGTAFINTSTGVFDLNSGANTFIGTAGQFNNNGLINVNSGTLRIASPGATDAGIYDIDSGQELQFLGNRTLGATSNITGAGTVNFAGGTQTINSTVSGGLGIANTGHVRVTASTIDLNTANTTFFNPLTVSGGFVQGSADITIASAGGLNWSGGIIGGTGSLVTPSGANTSITGPATIQRDWSNTGNITLDASGTAALTVQGAHTLTNSGTMQVNSTGATPLSIAGPATVANTGTINWNSGVANSIGGLGKFDNNGSVNITDGTLSVDTASGTDSGSYAIASTKRLNFSGSRSLAAGSNVTGLGTLGFTNATQTVSSTNLGGLSVAGTGHVVVSGAIVNLNTPATTFSNPLTLSSGSLRGSADITIASLGGFIWGGGAIEGTGSLHTANGSTTSITGAGTAGRNWTNAGTIDFTGSTSRLTLNSNLSNQVGGVINMNSTFNGAAITLNTASTSLNNAGTINWNSGATAPNSALSGVASTSFNNSGQFNLVGNSQLNLSTSSFTQNGTLDIAAGSTLTRNSGIANAGTLRGGGSVNVGASSLSSVGGTLSPGGLGAVATLSIAGNVDFTSATLLFDLGNVSGDRIAVNGNLNSGGATSKLYETGGSHLDFGDAYSLVTYSGGLTGAPLSLQSQNADISFVYSSTGSSNGALVATTGSIINRWVNASGTVDWATASNWSRAHVPTANEDVLIAPGDVGRAVTLSSGIHSIRSLTVADDDSLRIAGGTLSLATLSSVGSTATLNLANGTLDGAGDLAIAGRFNWSGGVLGGAGDLTTTLGASSVISGGASLQRDWSNVGSITLNNGASTYLHLNSNATLLNTGTLTVNSLWFATALDAATGSTITNASGGVINWNTGATNGIGGGGSFNNNGQLTVSGNSTLNLQTALGTDGGDYTVDTGSRLNFASGTRSLGAGSDINGMGTFANMSGSASIGDQFGIASAGTVRLENGTLTLNSPLTFTNPITQLAGTLTGSADITLASGSGWLASGGTLAGTGDLITQAGSSSVISGGVSLQRDWSNAGNITIDAGTGNYLHLNNSATLLNSGALTVNSTWASSALDANTGSAITNTSAGTISWATGISNSIAGAGSFNNNGQLTVSGNSTLSLQTASGTDGGDYTVDTGSRLNFASGTRSLGAGSDVNGAGTFANMSGSASIGGQFGIASTGILRLENGTLALNTPLTFTNPITQLGGTLTGSSDITLASSSGWLASGGTLAGTGDLITQAGSSSVISSGVSLQRDWSNAGNIALSNGAATYLHLSNGAHLINNSVLNVNSTWTGSVLDANTGSVITNNGTINWNTGVSSSLGGAGSVNNASTGQFNVSGANTTLSLDSTGLTLAGTLDIGAGTRVNRTSSGNVANAGLLKGGGTFDVGSNTLTNSGGTISPGGNGSVATLTIAGNADLTSAALLFDIDTGALYDRLAVSGSVTVGSAPFVLSEISGNYTAGDNFSLVTYGGAISGAAPTLDAGAIADVTFTAATTGPSGGAILASVGSVINRWLDVNGSWQTGGNWSRGHVPTLTEDVVIDVAGPRTVLLSVGTGQARSFTIGGDEVLSLADSTTLQLGNGSSTIGAGTNLNLDNSTIQGGAGSSILNQGTISGSGIITVGSGGGTLTNLGTLAPGDTTLGVGFGTLAVAGNLILGNLSQAVFDMSLANSDRVNVTGNVSYAGSNGPTLTVSETGGASFLGGETRTLISSGGVFTAGNGASTGGSDVEFRVDLVGSNLTANVIGIANTWAVATPTPLGGFWSTGLNWSRGTAPNAYHDVTINQGSTNLVNVIGTSHARSLNLSGSDNTLRIGLGGSLALHHGDGNTISSIGGGATLHIGDSGILAIGGSASGVGTLNNSANILFGGNGTISARSGAAAGAFINNTGTINIHGGNLSDNARLGLAQGGNTVSLLNNATGGTISATRGTMSLLAASVTNQRLLDVADEGKLYFDNPFNNDGTINLGGGGAQVTMNLVPLTNNSGALIRGAGSIFNVTTLTNHGTLAPGQGMAALGILETNGNYVQGSAGVLDVRTDTNGSDVFQVSGLATLDGTLKMSVRGGSGHALAAGQVYSPLVASSVGGMFAAVTGVAPYVASDSYVFGAQVTLSNPVGSIVWDGSAGDFQWDNPLNWNLDRLPGLGDTVIVNPAAANATITLDTGSGFSLFQLPGDDTLLINTGGSLGLPGGSMLNGTLHVNGGTLDFLGANTASRLDVSSGQVNVSGGNVSVNTLTLSGGNLNIAASRTLTLSSLGTWNGAATIAGLGGFNVDSYASLVLSGSGSRTLDNVAFNNSGIMWLELTGGGRLELINGAVLTNSNVGSLMASSGQGNQTIYSAGGGAGTVVNSGGHMEAQSGASLLISTASLSIASGSFDAVGGIRFEPVQGSYSGAMDISAGTLSLGAGNHVFADGASLSGFGLMDIHDASSVVQINDFYLSGNLAIHDGSLTINAGKTLTVDSIAYLDLTRSVAGSGTIHNYGTVETFDPGVVQTIAPHLINDGELLVGSNLGRSLEFLGGLTLNASSTVNLNSDATIKRAGGITNNGTITSSGHATIDVGTGSLTGSGTLTPGGVGSIATISIAGNADFTSATLQFDLESTSSFDQIYVTGTTTLAATTNIQIAESSAPFVGSGDSFEVLYSGNGLVGALSGLNSQIPDVNFTSRKAGNSLFADVSSVITRWNTDLSGDWDAATNWSRGHAPRSGEGVVIDRSLANPEVTIDLGIEADALSIDFGAGANDNLIVAGTLNLGAGGMHVPSNSRFSVYSGKVQGAGDITLAGLLDWSGGEIAGAGNVVVQSGGTFNMSGGVAPLVLSRNLQNNGTVFWDAGEFQMNANLTNNTGGLFHAGIADQNTDNITGSGIFFNNSGSEFRFGGGGATDLSMLVDFRNAGLVTVTSAGSSLDLHIGATHAGTFDIATNGTLSTRGSGNHVFGASSSIQGAGRHVQDQEAVNTQVLGAYGIAKTELSSGSLSFGNGGITVSAMNLSGGTLGTSAALAIGSATLSGGTLNVGSGQTLSLSGNTILSGDVIGAGSGQVRNLATGTVSGAGTLGVGTGLFRNLGTISPGTGAVGIATIKIAGNADLTSGTVDIGLQNVTTYDKLAVQGDLVSGGALKLNYTGAPFLAVGDAIQPLSFGGNLTGTYPTIDSSSISGLAFNTTIGTTVASAFTLTAGALGGIFWDGEAGDGLWSSGMNWSSNSAPVAGQSVTISPAVNTTVTISTDLSLLAFSGLLLGLDDALMLTAGGSLALPSANLNLGGTVSLQNGTLVGSSGGALGSTFNWSGGTLAGGGSYTASTVSLSGGGVRVLDGMTLNSGPSTLTGGELSLRSGTLTTGSFGLLINSTASLSFDGGTLLTTGLTNTGRVNVNTGSVSLNNTALQTGAFSIAAGANMAFGNNATLSPASSVTGGSWTVGNGKTVISQGSLNRGAGSVTLVDVNGKLNMTGGLETDELILHAGASLTGSGGALKVNTALDTFITANPISGFGSATMTQVSGDLVLNQDLSVTGAAVLNALAGAIENTSAGATLTAGSVSANAFDAVDLNLVSNSIGASSANDSIFLNVVSGPTQITSLSTGSGQSAQITSKGNVGQTGVINTLGSIILDVDVMNGVAWLNGGNQFGEGVHINSANKVQLASSAAKSVAVSGTANEVEIQGGAVQLGAALTPLTVSGPLTVVASANITQGAALNITGLTDLRTTGGSIVLPTASTYTGGVKFSAPLGSAQFNSNGAISLRGSAGNDLSLQAGGNVTQPGVAAASLVVGGNALINAAGFDVILTNSNNDFGGLSVTAANLTAVDKNSVNLAGTIGGDVQIAFAGSLTSGTLGSLSASSLLAMSNAANGAVNLAASVGGNTDFAGAGSYATINYTNAKAGTYADLTASTSIQVMQTGALDLPDVNAPQASFGATGAVTQSGQINVGNLSIFAAGQDVSLLESANLITNVNVLGKNVSLVSAATVNPDIDATGSVSITASGINQSVGNLIKSAAFSASVSGGLGLFGPNQLGSITAAAGVDMDIRDVGSSLQLGNLQAGTSAGISLNATGAVSQAAGTSVQASKVSLTGGSLGSSGAPIEVEAAQVRINASNGDAYVRNSQASELVAMQALGTLGTANYSSAQDIDVVGNVSAANVQLQSGDYLFIGNDLAPVSVTAGNSISLQGLNITIAGGTVAGASAQVISQGSATVTTAGNFVIQGGGQQDTFASIKALGPVNTLVGGTLNVIGGTGINAYALLDPAAGSPLNVTAGAINLQGGQGAGAFAAIVSDGDISLNASSLSLTGGSGMDADAVVVSNFGRISAPDSCNGCVELSSMPLGNGSTGTGIFSGGKLLAQSNSTSLLTTQLFQIESLIKSFIRESEPDSDKDKREKADITVEGLICP